jgi:prephenate dehydrogenase
VFGNAQQLIATHPLFGPDSISKTGLPGKKIVVANLTANEENTKKLEEIFASMQLHIIHCSPEEHDKQMAKSQALIHFLGRAFARIGLEDQEISTPDYQSFVRINDLVNNDTWQLFFDMQTKNPFAKEVRMELLDALKNLEEKIEQYET